METFGERLEYLRKQKGYKKHQDFAEAIEKKRQTVASWESGRTEPAFKDLMTISDLLGCTIDYLVKGTSMQQNMENLEVVPLEEHQKVVNENGSLKITVKTLSQLLGKPKVCKKQPGGALVFLRKTIPFAYRRRTMSVQ